MTWPLVQRLRRVGLIWGVLALCTSGLPEVVAKDGTLAQIEKTASRSPVPERVAARDAWRLGEACAAALPLGDVMVGSGDSMMPLYPDRTVIVLHRQTMSELRPGMTVVFIGDRGRPVAHVLVAKTSRGWTARGLANAECDRTLVRSHNYVGTVVRAFLPVPGEVGAQTAALPTDGSVLGDAG